MNVTGDPSYSAATSAWERHRAQLVGRSDVLGGGIGERYTGGRNTHEVCVKVFVVRKVPLPELAKERVLPRILPSDTDTPAVVDVEEMEPPVAPLIVPRLTGMDTGAVLRAAGPTQTLAGRSGASVGIPVGTIGILARPAPGSARAPYSLFVSCNHVLAGYNSTVVGTPILSPAVLDGGLFPWNCIGSLAGYVPLRFGPLGPNFVDVALGRLLWPQAGPNTIGGIGPVHGATPADEIRIGETVLMKAGRTSGVTSGEVMAIHATIKVDYWPLGVWGRNTFFFDQIITTPMGMFGDSGSVAVDSNHRAAGLLFAGSATHTFFNYFDRIAKLLRIEL